MQKAFDSIKERLKKEKEEYEAEHAWNYAKGLEYAIEIVNQVAEEYKQEVCEWKVEQEMFIQNPHTGRKFSNEPSMRNIYCNTCGKKIKGV